MRDAKIIVESGTKFAPDFPDFFIVGAPKCGTTSLHAWLCRHPALHMPVKEPGFFSQDILPLGKMLHDYLPLYSAARPGQLIGESTPKYLFSSLGLQHIKRLNPRARILAVLRPPVELVHSFHGQMLREGEENERSFERAWRLVPQRREGRMLPRTCRGAALLDYPAWGELGTRLKEVFSLFSADQVKVFLLEELRDQPGAVYRDALAHLGQDDDGFADFPVLNEGWNIRHLWLHRAVLAARRRAAPALQALHVARGGQGTGLLKWLNRFNRAAPTGVTNAAFSEELAAHFLPEVEILEDLLGRDLAHWKRGSPG
jgi:hypothetical protein